MENQPLKTIKLIDNPAYYASLLVLNTFLATTSIVLLNNRLVLNYNAVSFMVSFALAVDLVVRGRGRSKDYFYRRYNVQVVQSILSLTCLMFAYRQYPVTLLIPLIFYRLHYDVIKDMDNPYMRATNYIFLVGGLVYTPLVAFYGNIQLNSPVFVVYIALSSYTAVSLFREYIKNPNFVKDLSLSISLVNRESVGIASLMLKDSVEGIKKDMEAVAFHHRCPWHTGIVKDLEVLDNKYSSSEGMELDLNRFMQIMKEKYSIGGYNIIFTGLEGGNEGGKPVVVAALVKYFVDLLCYNFNENISNPTVWVTSIKNRITVKDNLGGTLLNRMTETDRKTINGLASHNFFKLYNIKVLVEGREDNGFFVSNKATILF